MKATELMIGDWVIVYEKAMPVKARVEGVFGRGAMVLGHVRSADHGFMEPIPLTPEILEKNGFTSYGEAWYLPENKATGNEKILVGFYMYETYMSVRNGAKCFDNRVPCKYRACAANRHVFVHELQHTLRLCGIEKEITL